MGKKKKKSNAILDSFLGKNRDLEERYNVPAARFARPDSPQFQEATNDRKNYEERMVEGFRNDYDARRTLEAAALSGKGKAKKMLDKGFKDVSDVRNAQNFFEKAAKRHGQGGSFSSASDYMGLTQSMVERDREKLITKLQGQRNSDNNSDGSGDNDQPRVDGPASTELSEARARVATHEEEIYNGSSASNLFDMSYDPSGANNFLERYKVKLNEQKQRYN